MPKAGDNLSGAQLEKLGNRLRAGPLTLPDLRQLGRFLETLEPFAEETYAKIREIDAATSGLRSAQIMRRSVKTTRSILAKLRRQTTTLVQVQDLVGCRIVVPDVIDQNAWLSALASLFPSARVVDRRKIPSNGYRAVHLIVREGIRRFEIQLRTVSQESWANVVEKTADRLGVEIKYGGGEAHIQRLLLSISDDIASQEAFEEDWQVQTDLSGITGTHVVRLQPRPVVYLESDAESKRNNTRSNRGDVELYSNRRLPKGCVILVGRPQGPVERASLSNESPIPEEVQQWIPFNFSYDVVFEEGQDVVDRLYDSWEADLDRGENINASFELLERFLQ